MVSMCPYKWALYALSVWATLYVMLELAMAWRDAGATVKRGYEPGPVTGEESEDGEEEEDEFEFDSERRPVCRKKVGGVD